MRKLILAGIALTVCLLSTTLASAEDTKSGEIWVTLKGSDYAKPYFEGTEHEDHEFLNNGYKLVIRVHDIDREYTFTLKPSNDELAPIDIVTSPKKFKKKRMPGRKYRMVMKLTAKFKKAPPEPAAKPEPKKDAPVAPSEEEMEKEDAKKDKKEKAKQDKKDKEEKTKQDKKDKAKK